jgi:hypothetical protein
MPFGEHEVVVLKSPAKDGSRVALRGRRCSSPGPERPLLSLRTRVGDDWRGLREGAPSRALTEGSLGVST